MKSISFIALLIVLVSYQTIAQNHAPVAVKDSIEVMAQVPILIDVKANDYDPDGDSIIISTFRPPLIGEATIENEMIRYKSSVYINDDTFWYTIKDDQVPPLESIKAYVLVKVLPNPDVPVAVADTFELMRLLPHSIDIMANDYDPNGDLLKISEIHSGSMNNCTVVINPDSLSVTVTPGLDQLSVFEYRLKETGTETAYHSIEGKVIIHTTVNPDIPVIITDTAYATGGIPESLAVLANDSDPQGDQIEIKDFTQPKHGSVEQSGNNLVYSPDLSFAGVDDFYYSIREKEDPTIYSQSVPVTVFVSKNPDCPVGVSDMASGTTALPLIIDVLANDYDINGDLLEIMDVSSGTITADNKILYQSSPITLGQDSIRYRIRETGNPSSYSQWTQVNIQLAVNPDLPVAVTDYATTHAGIAVEIKPLLNDIQNAADTLILMKGIYANPDNNQGISLVNGDIVTFTPAYQAEGVQELKYFIRGGESQLVLATGIIYVTIIKQPCYDSLTVNNINAGVNANGYLFTDLMEVPGDELSRFNEMIPHYRFPKDAATGTLFSSSLWLGGFDISNNLHIFSSTYCGFPYQGMDVQAGPVSNVYDTSYYLQFGRTWKISKAEVEFHRQNYWKQGYQPVEAILSWPGNGHTDLGQGALLAPYFDRNSDGVYNCMDGDYPLIRGDQSIFLMFNDDLPRAEEHGLPMKAEVHAMVYGFDQPADTALSHTVFIHYDIINRSNNTYSNSLIGVYTDLDIGFANDDYLRCDVTRNSYYGYNGLETDGNGQAGSYGNNPPAQSVTILAGPFKDNDGLDNPNGGCNESINGLNYGNDVIDDERTGLSTFCYTQMLWGGSFEPQELTPSEYYDFLNGKWMDGTRFMYGGNGHPELGPGVVGPECNYMFPGDSDPLNWGTNCEYPEGGFNQGTKFWTEEQTGNRPGDRRGLGSLGPFTFSPGQVQEIEIAYVTGQGTSGPASSVNQMLRNIDSLRYAVANGELILPNNELGIAPVMHKESFNIYPNPASTFITIKGIQDGQPAGYSIYNMYGACVKSGKYLRSSHQNIDISTLTAGMYIIRLTSCNGTVSGKFIVK